MNSPRCPNSKKNSEFPKNSEFKSQVATIKIQDSSRVIPVNTGQAGIFFTHWHVITHTLASTSGFSSCWPCFAEVHCALCLLPMLLCLQGEYGVVYPLNLAQRIASRPHFLGSNKNEADGLFQEGQRSGCTGSSSSARRPSAGGGRRCCSTRPRTRTCRACALTVSADQAS